VEPGGLSATPDNVVYTQRRTPGQWERSPVARRKTIMIPFLHLGPITLPTFGLMVATAMLVSYCVLRADLRRRGIAAEAETLVAFPALAGMIGAKLYHALQSPRELFADPVGQLFTSYGFAWFGGLLGGIAAFVWLGRKFRIPLLLLFDVASPAAALGYGIGRIGCLLSGDGDYGIPTSLPWGMSFANGIVPTPPGVYVHPTPIYELIAAIVIAWWLWRLGAASGSFRAAAGPAAVRARPASHAAGLIFAAYLVSTGAARFLVEFIRINPRSFLGMTNAQVGGVASILAGAALAVHLRGRARQITRVR
jgi:phosphatidylglycerol---prolipoprotein diacylglyceryl transferase